MKARLPYFLLALLTGSCFFSGSVQANPSPTDVEVRAKALVINNLGHRLAGRQYAVFPFFTEAAFLPTDTHTGSEKAGAHAEPAEIAAPVVENPIPAQTATEGTAFSFAFAENTFSDADGEALSYTATLTDENPLPDWLSFDGTSQTFSGIPAAADVGVVNIRVTATDPGGETALADFDLTVNSANNDPTVNAGTDKTITLPTNTTSFTATAEDTDGTIATYAWTTEDSPAGSTVTLAGAETNTLDVTVDLEGTYTFAVTVTDNDGATASDQVSLTVNPEPAGNVAPEVSITSPSAGDPFTAPAEIPITANASDADGTVAKVAFYKDTELLGEDTNAGDGWSFLWSDVAAGTYSLTAIATDDAGATTTSTAVEIAVTGENASPTVSITSPTEGATFTAPASITIAADASDTDGEVRQVVFFKGTDEIGTDADGTDGWSFLWADVAAGAYALTAIATDDLGATTTSPEVNIEVKGPNTDPVVSITSPVNGASFTAPAEITITADASDPDADGTLAKVEFFKGADKLGEDIEGSDGWSYRWSGVAGGSYTLTAIATDNLGATATSAGINIEVEGPNTDPVVSITSPANGERFTAPAEITITADASDPDAEGAVVKVEFFQGETNLGEDFTSPYSFTWSGVAAGTYALTAIATDDLGATTTSSVVNITVSDPLGTPVSIVPGSTCGPGTVTLSAEPGSGGDAVRWYDASIDGTPLDTTATGESYVTAEITITTSYWIATYNTSTLEESERVEIVATVKDVPPAPTVAVVDNCDGTSNLTASDYTGSLLWSTGETTETITITTAGEYTVTQTVDGCISAAGAGTAAPKATPDAPTVEAQNFCSSDSPTVADLPQGEGSYRWYASEETTEALASTEPLVAGTYYVSTTVDACESSATAVLVGIDPASVGGTVAGTTTVCAAGNAGTLTLSDETGSVVRWESSTDNGDSWDIISNTTNSQEYTGLTTTTQYRAVVQSGTCGEDFSEVATITVDPVSEGGTATPAAAEVCEGSETSISLTDYTGSIVRWEKSTDYNSLTGEGTWESASASTTDNINTGNLSVPTYFRAVVKSGACEEVNSTVAKVIITTYSVLIDADPVPYCGGGGGMTLRAVVYRNAEIVYPYLVNEYGEPVGEDGLPLANDATPILNKDFFTAEELETLPPIIIANAWRYFKPRVLSGEIVNADDKGNSGFDFDYDWMRWNGSSLVSDGNKRPDQKKASLSSTDWISIKVRSKSPLECGKLEAFTFGYRIYSGHPVNYAVTIGDVSGFCIEDITDEDTSNDLITLPAIPGYEGEDLVLTWYKVGSDEPIGTTTYPDFDLTILKSTFQDGDQVYIEFSSELDDYTAIPDNCRPSDRSTNTITINIDEPAAIDQDLVIGESTLCEGTDPAVFSITATGTNLQFEWYKVVGEKGGEDDLLLSDEGNINIETTATASVLTISSPTPEDSGEYYVLVSNDASTGFACETAVQISANAELTVNPRPDVALNVEPVCGKTTISAIPAQEGTFTYAWTVPAGVDDPGNVSSFETTIEGVYTVSLTDENTCNSVPVEREVTVNQITFVSEAALEVTWITEGTEWEVKAVEEVPGEFGEDPIFTWYKRVYPSEGWGDPIQVGPDSIYIERAPQEDLEFKVELMNSATCTRYELTNIGVTAQPVEMIYFRAEEQGEDVRLSWATATEKYNTGFEVQLSTDGLTFRKLAFVETLNGNSVETQEYTYIDREHAKQGTRYYRLQQIDVDGTTAYFGPIVVALRNTGPVKVYPNPFLDRLRLSIESEKAGQALLSVANNTGTVVLKQSLLLEKGANLAEILLDPHLPAGMYLLSTRIGGKTRHFKLFKQ